MRIGSREIGLDHPPYIVAEISANHNGDINNAFRLIDEAKHAGADAVKMQTFTPDTITMKSDMDDFLIKEGPWKGRTLYDLYQEAYVPYEWHKQIFDHAAARKIAIFSSVFDNSAVELLEGLNTPAYKIASFELTHIPLIQRVAKTGKPMIISTGMGSTAEIVDAMRAAVSSFKQLHNIALLHCVSAYPTLPRQANLPALGPLSELLGGRHVVGLSDHTLGSAVACAAVACGAAIIEKHLCLNRSAGGVDSSFSLEPMEFADLVRACREAWEATRWSPSQDQFPNRQFRRSIYVTAPISAGEPLSRENVRVIRPANGLSPKLFSFVLGQKVKQDLQPGTPLSLDHLLS